MVYSFSFFFFFQAEDGIRDRDVTGVQTCALPIYLHTIGTKVSKIELTVPYGADVEVQLSMSIFDIMGQRGFRDLVKETYYHGAQRSEERRVGKECRSRWATYD